MKSGKDSWGKNEKIGTCHENFHEWEWGSKKVIRKRAHQLLNRGWWASRVRMVIEGKSGHQDVESGVDSEGGHWG
jgi:hypothetical protein